MSEAPTVPAAVETEPPSSEPLAAAPALESEAVAAAVEPPPSAPEAAAAPEEPDHLPADLRLAFDQGLEVEGKVIGWNQGGFHVAIGNTPAFCPRSEMEIGHTHEPGRYLDQVLPFRILRVEDHGRRVVLSRTVLLREERKKKSEELRRSLSVGSVAKGRVRSMTEFGAFVDLGGVEGLVHVSEISRQRLAKPADLLKVGQEVEVKVIKIAEAGKRISLSIKALEPDPWAGVAERYKAGEPFSGKVLRKAEFGLFIELEPQIEGLVHLSLLPLGKSLEDPSLAPGETVTGWVREVDLARHRLSLALREVSTRNPWEGAESRYSEGTVVEGTVEKVAQFGVFIELEPGLTGLLPGSETGLPRGASLGRTYSPGRKVKVQIAALDVRKKRISLALEGKVLEGSRADYQAYMRRNRDTASRGLGPMAAALKRLREP